MLHYYSIPNWDQELLRSQCIHAIANRLVMLSVSQVPISLTLKLWMSLNLDLLFWRMNWFLLHWYQHSYTFDQNTLSSNKFPNVLIWLSVTHSGRLLSWINVWVSSSLLLPIQASQNESFPFWKTLEVVSQPLNEWQNGSDSDVMTKHGWGFDYVVFAGLHIFWVMNKHLRCTLIEHQMYMCDCKNKHIRINCSYRLYQYTLFLLD